MARTGRPRKYNIAQMIELIAEYTNANSLPILKELTYQNHWDYDYVMKLQREHDDLRQSIKRLLDKKEAQLERLGATGVIDKTMAIFSLKQLGWKDKPENNDGQAEPIEIILRRD